MHVCRDRNGLNECKGYRWIVVELLMVHDFAENLRMKTIFDEIIGRFPVRNTKEQKEAFRSWVFEEAQRNDLNAYVSEDRGHKNIVIGNPDTEKPFSLRIMTLPGSRPGRI